LGRDYDQLARPRQTGRRVALRVLLASRSIIDQQRTANRNALNALLRSVDLGIDARKAVSREMRRRATQDLVLLLERLIRLFASATLQPVADPRRVGG
jgi:hypothetical protein